MTTKQRSARTTTLITLALLGGSLLATAAWAQFNGGGPMPAPTSSPFGNGRANPPGANPFGRPGRLPFAIGTVQSVDAGAGTVTLTPPFGGNAPQTVAVTGSTKVLRQVNIRPSDLKIGDTVQVRGVPTGISAEQIMVGDSAEMPAQGMEPNLGPNRGPKKSEAAGQASAQASGKIITLSPLTIVIGDGVQVTLTTRADTKISRTVVGNVGDLKAGDRVTVNGQPGDNGLLSALSIRVSPPAPNMSPNQPPAPQ